MKHLKMTSLLVLSMISTALWAQQPITVYNELPNPKPTTATWQSVQNNVISWGSTDVRYKKEAPFSGSIAGTITQTAWRGERISQQLVVSAATPIKQLRIELSDLKSSKGNTISTQKALKGFVRYVMTDGLNKDGQGGCGVRPDHSIYDSSLVADAIDHLNSTIAVSQKTTQAVWIGIDVPQTAVPGLYTATATVNDGNTVLKKLTLRINVIKHTLPTADNQMFHLDLWQNPFAIARYHGVEPWSDAHLEAMKPYVQLYREAGGRSITCSIMHRPWNGQTYDPFRSMITWTKKVDGTWSFDFTVFDKLVEFMRTEGIKGNIYCYSMIPWALSFRYFDQASDEFKYLNMEPGSALYTEVWGKLLRDFAAHLKAKGWFDHTYLSMDERELDVMKKTIALIREADPNFKISLAGSLKNGISSELSDFCVSLRDKYTEEMKRERKAQGKLTTYYTCCTEPYPNTFTFSPPAEAEFLGWYAAKENLDGYLRWSIWSWVENPLQDSRFDNWAAGDTYMIYPGARSSIRFERLKAGIQAYEKVRLLREEFKNSPAKLKKINQILTSFDEHRIPKEGAAKIVNKARAEINRL